MHDTALYSQILGIQAPWVVDRVELSIDSHSVTVHLRHDGSSPLQCPECGEKSPGYDRRTRKWRHLDTCQYTTLLSAEVPRLECPEHGVRQVLLPWAEEGSRYTALFEALVIDWLLAASTTDVQAMMKLSWTAVDNIRKRAVHRGLARRAELENARLGLSSSPEPGSGELASSKQPVSSQSIAAASLQPAIAAEHLSVDEIARRKGHIYQTIITDQQSGAVLHVADGRSAESLAEYLRALSPEQRQGIRTISMDMHAPFIKAVKEWVPDAEKKICFDKFHIAQMLSKGVDATRRSEHQRLMAEKNPALKNTRYYWLYNPDNMTDEQYETLKALFSVSEETTAAWRLKEDAMALWHYRAVRYTRAGWQIWCEQAEASGIDAMSKIAGTIRRHLQGILNAMKHVRTNAIAESINSGIAMVKRRARGFRNPDRMRAAIFFHFGKLELKPASL